MRADTFRVVLESLSLLQRRVKINVRAALSFLYLPTMKGLMEDSDGLLLLEMPMQAVTAIIDDLAAEVDSEMVALLVQAGVEAKVFGVLAERRLAGEMTPNVWEAIMLAGCAERVSHMVRSRDKMKLTDGDVYLLEQHTLVAACEVTRQRHETRARRIGKRKRAV